MVGKNPVVGLLALQGAFGQHKNILEYLGCKVVLVKNHEQLGEIEGLVIPGGESGAMLRMLRVDGFLEKLQVSTLPVFGTCAGAILLAKTVKNPSQESFGKIPMTITRNGYGRQTDSFDDVLTMADKDGRKISARFIRAPIISKIFDNVEVLAYYKQQPVAVRYKKYIATTFHPELTGETYFHEKFLETVQSS